MKRRPDILSITFFIILGIASILTGCEEERSPLESLTPSEARPTGKREYGEIKPVVLPLPEQAVRALGGADIKGNPLENAHIYFRSMTLVVYRETFDVKDYIDRMAEAFGELAKAPEFGEQADSWAVQMQSRSGSEFVTLSCSPKETIEYSKKRDVSRLLKECDFLMINDLIISNPEERLGYYNGAIEPPEPQVTPQTVQ